jgi:hypothetical protein
MFAKSCNAQCGTILTGTIGLFRRSDFDVNEGKGLSARALRVRTVANVLTLRVIH